MPVASVMAWAVRQLAVKVSSLPAMGWLAKASINLARSSGGCPGGVVSTATKSSWVGRRVTGTVTETDVAAPSLSVTVSVGA